MDLHDRWRDGKEISRLIEVDDGVSFNVVLSSEYWSLYDDLNQDYADMDRVARMCWKDSQNRELGPMWVNDYETFRRWLVAGILLLDDGRKAIEEGRANDNQMHLAKAWLTPDQIDLSDRLEP